MKFFNWQLRVLQNTHKQWTVSEPTKADCHLSAGKSVSCYYCCSVKYHVGYTAAILDVKMNKTHIQLNTPQHDHKTIVSNQINEEYTWLTTKARIRIRTRSPMSGEISSANCWTVERKSLSLLSWLVPAVLVVVSFPLGPPCRKIVGITWDGTETGLSMLYTLNLNTRKRCQPSLGNSRAFPRLETHHI